MQVLLTGATGMVGRALTARLLDAGHGVTAAVRNLERARASLGPGVELFSLGDRQAMAAAVERCNAVVNLAGEPLFDGAWTPSRKRALYDSRVALTRALSEHIRYAAHPPRVLVSASGVNYYADAGDRTLDENATQAEDFLGQLCNDWEAAARSADSPDTRVVCLRIGVVLSPSGGALAKMLPVFRMGLGGRLGSGRQYFSWIHLDDLVSVILFALQHDSLWGAVNATSPLPVTNAEFTDTLGALLHRPTVLPVPALALRLGLGERASVLTTGVRVVPKALQRAGYNFRFETVRDALSNVLAA